MGTAIAYDRPVTNLIAGLDATGHVTHRAYRKTSVTMHHNGGRLSHRGILDVWRTREASAHFDSDAAGAIAQFVRVNEYAWATGNTTGNMSSISIEMCNSTTSPSWGVSPTTWRSAARLAGWLFAKVIGTRPNSGNFFVHSHWTSTDCAGPSIRASWTPILAAAQAAYDYFKGVKPPPPSKPINYTINNVKAIQRDVRLPADGVWGRVTDAVCNHVELAATGKAFSATMVQKAVGTRVDGDFGPASRAALVVTVKAIQHDALGVLPDGKWGISTSAAYDRLRTKFWG
jgi:hypothetical protein